ncbi:unnamed protein product [Rotaria socialis]
MASLTPPRTFDSDSNPTDNRLRSSSLSSSTRASHSVSREPLSQRSQTPKARRKNVSNRLMPYTSPVLSRTTQSTNSTITIVSNNQDLDDNVDLSSIDVNIVHVSSQQTPPNHEQDAFERSLDEDDEDNKENVKPSKHLSIAKVLSHFTSYENNKFRCNLCKELKTTNGSSTFNLRRHLVIRHQINAGITSSFDRRKNAPKNRSVIDRERRQEIDGLLLNCVIHGGLPYNHFSHPWYDALFEKLESGYRAPDRHVWKGPTRDHYICLTAHVFNNEMKPISLLLSFRRLTNRKLSKNLNEFIAYELNRFGLNDCSHAGITTDNASDIKAATESGAFGPRFPCIGHTLNLIINHALCIWNKPNENWYPFKSYQKNIGLDDGDDDFIDIDDDVEDEIVDAEQASRSVELSDNGQPNENNDVNVSLNDDILSPVPPTNLLDEDEFISDDDDSNDSSVDLPASNDNEKNQLLDVLRKSHGLLLRTRKMVKIMRNVSSIDQYVRNHEHGPCNGFVIDIRTRWSSTFHMLKRLIHYQEIVKSVFIHKFPSINGEQRSSLAKVYIDHENWDLLQALQDVLEPL